MKSCNIIFYGLLLLLSISCSQNPPKTHVGEKTIKKEITSLDSIVINADSTSGRGNFYMVDSSIYFADTYNMSLFQYDACNGQLIARHFGLGQGPNELSSFMYAYPIRNTQGECFILNSSMSLFTYNSKEYNLTNRGQINFGWDDVRKNDYHSPSVYNIMEMSDFGIDFVSLNDSTLLIPVNLINRNFDAVGPERYKEGHILAEMNLDNLQVKKVVGHFPDIYREKPTPFFEFFRYTLHKDTLFVSHATDSLIYVYEYPDRLLYTMGYEAPNTNRNYTVGYETDMAHFKEDAQQVGANIGLTYIKEDNLLLRTTLASFASGHVCLQAYAGSDLILESQMPDYFTLLGYSDGYYYGIRILPVETENGDMNFILYRFKIEKRLSH